MTSIYTTYRTLLLLAAASLTASCINDATGSIADGHDAAQEVTVRFALAGSGQSAVTRASEPGDKDLHENTISRLDLFVFNADGSLAERRKATPATPLVYAYSEDTQQGSWTLTDLTRTDVDGKKVYLTANWDGADAVSSLATLQKARITDFSAPAAVQTAFVMDGRARQQAYSDAGDWTVSVDLARAMSKIRLTVNDKTGNNIAATAAVAYQVVNYATAGCVLAENADSVPDAAQLASLPSATDFNYGSGMLPGNSVASQNGRAVFYTYPNNWWNGRTDPYRAEPVDENRQTCILLRAPYTADNGTITEGYYRIPVNNRLPEFNDKDITADAWRQLLPPFYNISRNTIYDVTVTIDRPGGEIDKPVELKLEYVVDDWTSVTNPDIEFD